MSEAFHYSPDLLNLLIETIPRLCKSKKDVLLYFQSAGVNPRYFRDLQQQVQDNPDTINKFEITRVVLKRLNQAGDTTLRDRREIIKRVTETADFSICWPDDQLEVKGLVAAIRDVVGIRDHFTRVSNEREEEKRLIRLRREAQLDQAAAKSAEIAAVKSDLYALFPEQNPQRRGKALEGVLNRLFSIQKISVHDAFGVTGQDGEGVVEQIDGVIKVGDSLYLVEMKWTDAPLGVGEVSAHLVRVYGRGYARAIIISASGYTGPAVNCCRDALQKTVVVLIKLEEIVHLLEQEDDMLDFLEAKITAAIVHKNPLYEPLT